VDLSRYPNNADTSGFFAVWPTGRNTDFRADTLVLLLTCQKCAYRLTSADFLHSRGQGVASYNSQRMDTGLKIAGRPLWSLLGQPERKAELWPEPANCNKTCDL